MKKYIGILGITIVVVVIALVFILEPKSDKKLIDNFLYTWFEKSEDNKNLLAILDASTNNAVIMGEGVDEEVEVTSMKDSEKILKEFENVYGEYFNDSAFREFVGVNYWYVYDIHSNNKEFDVRKVNISKDNSAYKFIVTLYVDGNEVEEEGRIELQDGKISSLIMY